jgi:hypothetical protein
MKKNNIVKLMDLSESGIHGKNTVIKTLVMPLLIQSLTVLPNPSDKIIN